jgi:hypothetical protein
MHCRKGTKMKKRHLLLRAAKIVEEVPPYQFDMCNLSCCVLGAIRRHKGFEKLNEALNRDPEDFVIVGARFFGISLAESVVLFDGYHDYSPKEAAAKLRMVAGEPPVRKRKPGTTGMKLVQKAVAEALAVPARRTREKV